MADDPAIQRTLDAASAATLLAIAPHALGGAVLRAGATPQREQWLAALRALLPPATPWRRLPLHIADSRLLGGLDLAATLAAGRPVAERGVLAETDGGFVLAAMAERLPPMLAGRLLGALDQGLVALERDGLALRLPARFGLLALDEGGEDERCPAPLRDRLAFHLELDALGRGAALEPMADAAQIAAARALLPQVQAPTEVIEALCATAAALGIESLRAPLLALTAARAAAALGERAVVSADDATLAARLVLAPRATRLPAPPEDEQPEPPPPDEADDPQSQAEDQEQQPDLQDIVLAATQASIPPQLLAQLAAGAMGRRSAPASGRGAALRSRLRGRPLGTRRGEPRGGNRLNLIETLRAAAPWQPLRARERQVLRPARIEVRREDFRIQRYKQRTQTTAIFAVDASGSAALHRLAEAKGAVELFLADCYVRRDQVALIAFRQQQAELLLPPTRSLARAKKSLAGLPGGGATPLAAALAATLQLADALRRRGDTVLTVLLTDGRGNVALDGTTGRAQAEADALAAARQLRAAGLRCLLIDVSPRPQPQAEQLATALGARYLPLPHADAAAMSVAVRAASQR
jgi:magnesium chelatase subunit D